jgi:hypothetical protein
VNVRLGWLRHCWGRRHVKFEVVVLRRPGARAAVATEPHLRSWGMFARAVEAGVAGVGKELFAGRMAVLRDHHSQRYPLGERVLSGLRERDLLVVEQRSEDWARLRFDALHPAFVARLADRCNLPVDRAHEMRMGG